MIDHTKKFESLSNHSSNRRNLLVRAASICAVAGGNAFQPSHALSRNSVPRFYREMNELKATGALETKSGNWRFDQYFLPPETWSWKVIDASDTGYVDQNLKPASKDSHKRIQLSKSPDGKLAFKHSVKKNEIVHPVGIDSAVLPADFNSFSRVLLRYHHWIGEHSNRPGKWVGLQLGRGWAGRKYLRSANDIYGDDGGSSTTMHPYREKQGGNGIRLLSTHTNQDSPYGELYGAGPKILPLGQWLTVDVVIDKNSGHRLYINGVNKAVSPTVQPIANWNSCRAIWYRTRLMHGGIPEDLPATNAYEEWFGGFFVAVV